MKRIILVVFLIAGVYTLLHAQVKVGLKGGANFSNLIVSTSGNALTDEAFQTKLSYHIGTYVNQSINNHFIWQIEVLFSNKGYIHKLNGKSENISLNYLNWPLLIIYKPVKILEFELGPELGYLISGESIVKNFDIGLDIGARFNISDKFNAGLRYCSGFPFKMNADQSANGGFIPTYQNNVVQVSIGFNIINEVKGAENR